MIHRLVCRVKYYYNNILYGTNVLIVFIPFGGFYYELVANGMIQEALAGGCLQETFKGKGLSEWEVIN